MLMIVDVGSNVSVNLTWEDVSTGNTMHVLGGKNLTQGEYVLFTGATLVLEPGDSFRIVATGTTPHVDALCTVTETFIPVG